MTLKKDHHLAVSEAVHRYIGRRVRGKNDFWCADDYLRAVLGLKRERA